MNAPEASEAELARLFVAFAGRSLARRKSRRTASTQGPATVTRFGTPLRISIATAPNAAIGTASLAEDVRLAKPALLYADVVTLYSPAAAMLLLIKDFASIDTTGRMDFMKSIYPLFDQENALLLQVMLAGYEQLAKKKRRSRDELLAYHHMRTNMEEMYASIDRIWCTEMVPAIEAMLESSGAAQLTKAIDAGLLEVDSLLGEQGDFDTDQVVETFVAKLAEVLSGGSYPLFDDRTGTMVRHGLNEGRFQAPPLVHERGKQVAAAAELMGRLPTFPRATIAEILDIRNELREPLVRFRSAMAELGKLVDASAHEEGFREQVDEVFRTKVEPALQAIDEMVRANSYLRSLIGQAIGDTKTLVAGVFGFAIAQASDLPQLLVTGGTVAVHALAKAEWERQERQRPISQQAMYFVYRAEQLLSGKG